jgi:hypothetical protein
MYPENPPLVLLGLLLVTGFAFGFAALLSKLANKVGPRYTGLFELLVGGLGFIGVFGLLGVVAMAVGIVMESCA